MTVRQIREFGYTADLFRVKGRKQVRVRIRGARVLFPNYFFEGEEKEIVFHSRHSLIEVYDLIKRVYDRQGNVIAERNQTDENLKFVGKKAS